MSELVKVISFPIDLSRTIEKTELHTLFVMGDNMAHRFELEIKNGAEDVSLDGCTVTGLFTCYKDKTTVTIDGTIEDGKAVVVLNRPCYTLHGFFALTIQIKSGDVETSVFIGEGFMRASKSETIIYDDYIIMDVDSLLTQIQTMKDGTEAANAAAAAAQEQAEAAKAAKEEAQTAANAAQGWADATATAQTLPAGSQATIAVATGETGAKMMTFGIPRGADGADGADGAPGKDGKDFAILGMYDTLEALQAAHPAGSAGDAWAVGTSASNTVYLWDTDDLAWVDVGSLQGAQGAQGEAGKAATVRVGTVTTLDAGSDATVTNVGTDTDAIFNFAIPRGANDLSAEDVGALSRVLVVTAVLAADGWSEATPFTQTVTLEDISASDVPDADIDMSGATADTAADIRAAWSLVDRIDTGDGTITVTCFDEAPGIELNIRLKVVR